MCNERLPAKSGSHPTTNGPAIGRWSGNKRYTAAYAKTLYGLRIAHNNAPLHKIHSTPAARRGRTQNNGDVSLPLRYATLLSFEKDQIRRHNRPGKVHQGTRYVNVCPRLGENI